MGAGAGAASGTVAGATAIPVSTGGASSVFAHAMRRTAEQNRVIRRIKILPGKRSNRDTDVSQPMNMAFPGARCKRSTERSPRVDRAQLLRRKQEIPQRIEDAMPLHISSKLSSARRAVWPLVILAACSKDVAPPVTGPAAENLRIASAAVAPPAASLT